MILSRGSYSRSKVSGRDSGSLQVFLSADVISAYSIENIRITQISDIVSDSLVICRNRICRQCITDVVGRSQTGYIIHHELCQMLQHRCVRQMIFRDQIPVDDRIVHVSDIVCPISLRTVFIGARQTTLDHIFIEELCLVLFLCIVAAEFRKAERENMDLNIAPCKSYRA